MAIHPFLERVKQGVVVFDGAMGTSIHAHDLPLEAYNGLENCSEILIETRPEVIEEIHRSFYAIGSDIVETNTFGASKLTLGEFEIQDRCYDLNIAAAQIARRAADAYHTPDKPRFVCGSIGPGTKLVSLRQVTYDGLVDSYAEQMRGLLDGGVDVLLIETCQDILQVKAAIQACRVAFDKTGKSVPIMTQVTVETTGTMLVGTDIAAAVTAIEAFPEVMSIGLNCATGPQEMDEHIRYLSRNSTRFISCQPNAGLPQVVDGKAHFPLTPEELARWLKTFVEEEGVRIVGGCCGTTPGHLEAIAKTCSGLTPATLEPQPEPAASSLYQSVPYRQDNSFLIVGERCNTNGSRKFKRLLAEGDIEGLVETALEQVPESHVLDVCVDYVGRDGAPDMEWVVKRFANDVTLPLMLDSTQLDVLETGLKLAGGKCIINSVNLEDGEEKLAKVAGLCRQYGAAVVALTIDEDPEEAMAKTADRKLAIAQRLHDLLVDKHGMRSEDIFFDCLTFPITTGNPTDRRLGLETLDGIERIMQTLPKCQSILGLSNISFGLEPAARAVLNTVFLHEARERGLTAAIVHASKILPRNEISDERWQGALDLVYDKDEEALERYIGLFEAGEKVGSSVAIEELPIEERLKQRIISGKKQGIGDDLDEARQKYPPLEIINTFLLDGMKVVGELFGSGQMQLPFVLKSAETMKAAVAHLEPFMEKVEGESNGKIILATVRGDVHDIGKNLVDIIISNNGYEVVNLGIKQPISNVITAFREHNADAIGLSGLLVKSTIIMRDDLGVLNDTGIDVPVILGGAALTRNYVEGDLREIYNGPLYYAKDAFEGLTLMRQIAEGESTEVPASTNATATAAQEEGGSATVAAEPTKGRSGILPDHQGRSGISPNQGSSGILPDHQDSSGDSSHQDSSGVSPDTSEPKTKQKGVQQVGEEAEQRLGLREVADSDEETGQLIKGRSGILPDQGRSGISPNQGRSGILPNQGRSGILPDHQGELGSKGGAGVSPANMSYDHPVPAPPFWGPRVLSDIPVKAPLGFINETMLFQVQWGFRKKGRSVDEFKKYIDTEVRPIYRQLVQRCQDEQILRPQAVYGYWPCNSDGESLVIYEPPVNGVDVQSSAFEKRELCRFTFPRQSKKPFWCLADFWRPIDDGAVDVAAFHIVTAGDRVSEVAREWFSKNEFQNYLFLHGLGVETAEALAEYIHKQVRMELGIAAQDQREIRKLFQQGYQGSRYSFGYPACPNLEDQEPLVKLLESQRIGVELSEGYQLHPEQSTSAIIAYHPQARYFNVR